MENYSFVPEMVVSADVLSAENTEEAEEILLNFDIAAETAGGVEQYGAGTWIRPLAQIEQMFALGGYLKSINTAQAVWLSSEEELLSQTVRRALVHLVRRIAILNLCIQRRGLQPWFRRVDQTTIDFEESTEDAMEVFHKVRDQPYDIINGPLWLCRMVRVPDGEANPRGITAKFHTMVVFGIHHSITDASTNLFICNEFIGILNDILRGRQIVDRPCPFSLQHAEKITNTPRSYLMKIFIKRFYKLLILDFTKRTTFDGIIPLPKYSAAETSTISHIFDEKTTQSLLKICKENKTTVHACILTAVNAAYLDVVNSKSKKRVDSIDIFYIDCIDLRRYYPNNPSDVPYLGCHITLHEQQTVASTQSSKNNFWHTTRALKMALHEDINDKQCIKILPFLRYGAILFPINYLRNKNKTSNMTDCHYITTNMGDCTKSMDASIDPSDPVQVTDIFRSVSGEISGHYFVLTFHTFRKRLYVSFDYFTNKMSAEQASSLFENMKANLFRVAENGSLTSISEV